MSDERTPPRGRLREHVAEEIRVLLARKRMSGAELGRRAGIKQSAISRRITGEVAFDMDDLEAVADVLGIDVGDLLPQSVTVSRATGKTSGGGDLNDSSGQLTPSAVAPRPNARPSSHVSTRPGPLSHGRRDATRPVSAVPAHLRRPTSVRPPVRSTPR